MKQINSTTETFVKRCCTMQSEYMNTDMSFTADYINQFSLLKMSHMNVRKQEINQVCESRACATTAQQN